MDITMKKYEHRHLAMSVCEHKCNVSEKYVLPQAQAFGLSWFIAKDGRADTRRCSWGRTEMQLLRQQLLLLSTTPVTTSDIRQATHGHRPTQAKSLSLGEYVFLTDITFMFTHSLQLSVLILFHCIIHASLIFFFQFSSCVFDKP